MSTDQPTGSQGTGNQGTQGTPPEDPRTLLGAYAVDAVDDVERRQVERLVATDEDAADELAGLQAAAAHLGQAAALAPPAGLREAVLAEAARTPQEAAPDLTDGTTAGSHASTTPSGLHPVTPIMTVTPIRAAEPEGNGPAGAEPVQAEPIQAEPIQAEPTEDVPLRAPTDLSRRRRSPLMLAAAAAAVAVLAVPGVVAWQQAERAQQAEAQASTLTELLGGAQTVLVRGEVAGGGEAVALLGDRSAALVASDLPELDEDAVYQLWAMRDGVPVDAGLLEVREGQVQATAAEYQPGDGLAVSVEPAGGSAQPTTDPVVVLLPG